MYLHFLPALGPLAGNSAGTERYLEDLNELHHLLGRPSGFPFYLVEVPLEPAPAFDLIKNLPKKALGTAESVKTALIAGGLFRFDQPRVHRVS
jgi:hypothetical protein